MSKKLCIILLFCLAIFTNICEAKDADYLPDVPKNNIYFQDYANIGSNNTKESIMMESKKLRKETTAQVVVVTVDTIKDIPITDYSNGLFRKWKIGDKDKNNGVLLLIVKDKKNVRIEVGYGLEGTLYDSLCNEIITDKMQPYLEKNDYNGAIINGYNEIVKNVYNEYSSEGLAEPVKEKSFYEKLSFNQIIIAIIVFVVFIFLFIKYELYLFCYDIFELIINIIMAILSSGGGDGFGGGDSGGGGCDD